MRNIWRKCGAAEATGCGTGERLGQTDAVCGTETGTSSSSVKMS